MSLTRSPERFRSAETDPKVRAVGSRDTVVGPQTRHFKK